MNERPDSDAFNSSQPKKEEGKDQTLTPSSEPINLSSNAPRETHFHDLVTGPVHAGTGNINNYYAVPPQSPPASREELLEIIREANAELRDVPDEIAGVHIDRSEVGQIVEWILQANSQERLGMVLDQPGSGKTVVMHDVLVKLENENVPVLAIKADFLSGIRTRNDLAERLGLPDTVESCARHLAVEGLFVILLDQLDALSLSLSRDQATLDVMLSTLVRLRNLGSVRIVASCRTFDLNNDPKLSQMRVDHKFPLQPFVNEEINKVLQVIGVDPVRLLPTHRALLSIPLNLDVYARVVAANTSEQPSESFYTLQQLYQALWQKRIEIVPPSGAGPTERIAVINRLVEVMQNGRQIAVPIATLDDYVEATTYLERVGFIRREGNNWTFFHQTLFDYCYARRFVSQGRSLSQEILESPQGLFERSQMVQVLAYLRGADETVYRRELMALLFSDDLRPHLDLLLIDWFGSLPNPSTGEMQIALRLIKEYEDQARFLRAISGNVGWFERMEETFISTTLHSNENQRIDLTVGFLATLINLRTDDVLSYLKPFLGANEDWNHRIIQILSDLENWQNEIAVQMLCDLIINDQTFGYEGLCLQQLGKSNPANGCRVLRVCLDKRVDDLLQHEASGTELENVPRHGRVVRITDRHSWDQYLLGEYSVDTILNEANEKCPEKIIEHLLPWFKETCETLSDVKNSDHFSFDPIFSSFWYGDHLNEGPKFARQIALAMRQMAHREPPEFRSVVNNLALSESLSIHRVVIRGYLADPHEYADDACNYLLSDPRRLNIGEPLESSYYDSRRLYAAIFPHLNSENRQVLEEIILQFNPVWEFRRLGRYGITQLSFLKGVPIELLSEKARRRQQELENKFPDFKLRSPQGATVGGVGPPIELDAQAKMSDEAWLGAMRKYNDDTEWDGPKEHFLKGGVIELSRSFTEQVKQDPERFYHLAQRFDETPSLHYVAAAITGLAESDSPPEWVFDLVRHFASRLEGEFRRYVCRALSKRAEEEIPDDLLDLMSEWALYDPDPEQEMWRTLAGSGQPYYSGDPHFYGINTNRGSAVRAVCHCAYKRTPSQFERTFTLLEQVSENDSSSAVRSCVLEVLGPLLNQDVARTLDIFESTVEDHPVLLQSPLAHRFLSSIYREHFDRTRPYIEILLTHSDDSTRQAGARLACLVAFFHPDATELAKQALNGDEFMRQGAALIYARNLENEEFSEICKEHLLILMHDPDERVREIVGECFMYLRDEQLDGLRQFVRAFLNSPALLFGAEHLIEYLNPLANEEHDLALLTTEHILDDGGDGIFDIRYSLAIVERDLVKLPLTVYTHTLDSEQKERAMQLFELMLVKGSRSAHKALGEWDQR